MPFLLATFVTMSTEVQGLTPHVVSEFRIILSPNTLFVLSQHASVKILSKKNAELISWHGSSELIEGFYQLVEFWVGHSTPIKIVRPTAVFSDRVDWLTNVIKPRNDALNWVTYHVHVDWLRVSMPKKKFGLIKIRDKRTKHGTEALTLWSCKRRRDGRCKRQVLLRWRDAWQPFSGITNKYDECMINLKGMF